MKENREYSGLGALDGVGRCDFSALLILSRGVGDSACGAIAAAIGTVSTGLLAELPGSQPPAWNTPSLPLD